MSEGMYATKSDLARVEARIDGHEDVCAERMRRIDLKLEHGDQHRAAMRQEMREGFDSVKESVRSIYGRMWVVAGVIIIGEAGAIGFFLVKYGLTGQQ